MADPNPMLSYVTPERRRRISNAMMAEQYAENPPQLPPGYDWNGAPLSPELLAFAAQRGQPGVIQKALGLIPGFDQDGARGRQSWDNAMMSTAQFPIDAVAGMGQALTAPARAYRGEFDPLSEEGVGEALNVAGNAMMGGYASPKPRNVVGSAGGSFIPDAAALDMSHSARMKRAADGGFHPSTFYHGTADDFLEFDLSRGGQVTGMPVARQGISISPTTQIADFFAQLASDRSGGNAAVMPLRARLGKVGSLTLDVSSKQHEIAATLRTYFDNGYDTVVLKNYDTGAIGGGMTVLIVKDPAQLRSVNAAFDPAKRDSANLMSANGGRLGAALGPIGGVSAQEKAIEDILGQYGIDQPSSPASPQYRPGDA